MGLRAVEMSVDMGLRSISGRNQEGEGDLGSVHSLGHVLSFIYLLPV